MSKFFTLFPLIVFLTVSLIVVPGAFADSNSPKEETAPDIAETRPFQASLTPDMAIQDRNVVIEGLTLNIWGENPQRALSLGFVNGSIRNSSGFSWGVVLNYANSYRGVHWACVNYTKNEFIGWQGGLINYTNQHFEGFQSGLVNYARQMSGFQLGVLNFAEASEDGAQLGLLNVISENKWFSEFPYSVAPAMIFFNWRF